MTWQGTLAPFVVGAATGGWWSRRRAIASAVSTAVAAATADATARAASIVNLHLGHEAASVIAADLHRDSAYDDRAYFDRLASPDALGSGSGGLPAVPVRRSLGTGGRIVDALEVG